ncbi:MAG: 3'-5' exonuclease [Planctomycetes bacterium]|nr:3'-5' exonuclease [Planctomycetota bacterium]
MDQALVCIDTETATMQGAPHLLELGAVRVVDGEIEDTFESLVCPVVPIDPGTTAIHGLTDRDVAQAPFAAEVLRRFREWVGDDPMAAHNAPFDTRVLAFEYQRAGIEPPTGAFLDSLPLSRRWIPEATDHKLLTLCQMLDLDEGQHHRALSDAVWCWKIVEECLHRAEEATPQTPGKPGRLMKRKAEPHHEHQDDEAANNQSFLFFHVRPPPSHRW